MIIDTLITTGVNILTKKLEKSPARQALATEKARKRFDRKEGKRMERAMRRYANKGYDDFQCRVFLSKAFQELDSDDLDVLYPSTAVNEEE